MNFPDFFRYKAFYHLYCPPVYRFEWFSHKNGNFLVICFLLLPFWVCNFNSHTRTEPCRILKCAVFVFLHWYGYIQSSLDMMYFRWPAWVVHYNESPTGLRHNRMQYIIRNRKKWYEVYCVPSPVYLEFTVVLFHGFSHIHWMYDFIYLGNSCPLSVNNKLFILTFIVTTRYQWFMWRNFMIQQGREIMMKKSIDLLIKDCIFLLFLMLY